MQGGSFSKVAILPHRYQGRGPQLSIDAPSTSSSNGAGAGNTREGKTPAEAGNPRTAGGASTCNNPAGAKGASTTTYSMSLGLAKILRERGMYDRQT